MKHSKHFLSALFFVVLAPTSNGEAFYKQSPLFTTAPGEAKSMTPIKQFGPVGIGIEFHQPAFTMKVGNIEDGSPAAATGAFKIGQTIVNINGQTLKDIDPRIQLAEILGDAEAGSGVLTFTVKDQPDGKPVEIAVRIPKLGSYSKTWPLNCEKSDKIVRNFCDYISKPDAEKGFAGGGMLMLVSNGTEQDLKAVGEWVLSQYKNETTAIPWHIGFGGIVVCEYYLKTGDPVALKLIQRLVKDATASEYFDGWSGRGGVTGLGYGRGHLNAGGTAVVTFLLLAKQCGADIDDSLLHRTLTHFFRYAGRGLNPYGDDRPELGFVDNGKTGNLAFAMAAAASLTPDGENSIYARARDICAMSGFYTTTFMLQGHTGGGVGEIWRSAAMCLLQDIKPAQYRDFLDNRKWHYELSRRHDGTFTILGGARYENTEWGGCYPWVYAIPRKNLRISGAPPTKYSKTYQLPARPWGAAADDIFLSLESATDKNGKSIDLSGETLAKDSGKPLIERLQAQGELSDDEIRRYARHPDLSVRNLVVSHAAGYEIKYMFAEKTSRLRPHLLEEFATDKDPRVRHIGIKTAASAFDPATDWSKRLFELAIKRLEDDSESWFVKDACLSLLSVAPAELLMPHISLLETYLKHTEHWLQNGALLALVQVGLDERACDRVLPIVGDFISRTQRQSTTGPALYDLRKRLPEAPDKVQAAATAALGKMYANYNTPLKAAGGLDLKQHRIGSLKRFAETLIQAKDGAEVLYAVAKKEFPDELLPHDELFLEVDFESFSPELRKALLPVIRDKFIYQFIIKNRGKLLSGAYKPSDRHAMVTNTVDELVALYQKIGVNDYDWKTFGPDLRNEKWNYFSYEPQEKQAYDKSPWRYRLVSPPAGMENWFKPEFNAASAGWKEGLAPFGQYNGKLQDNSASERNLWHMTPRSLWEHEVLMVRGSFKFPSLKPDHMYRLRSDRGQGVGAGDGFKLYINGKPLAETNEGLGRRLGDLIRGGWITSAHSADFTKGPVTIAAITFLRYGDRAISQMPPVPQGIFQLCMEERKIPQLYAAMFHKAVTQSPMLNSKWQAAIQLDPSETDSKKFIHSGTFVSNPKMIGRWKVIAVLNQIEDFKPAGGNSREKTIFNDLELREDGSTQTHGYIWSDNILMDLDRNQALEMQMKTIDGRETLFIEIGGFSLDLPPNWKSQWMVLQRK